MKHQRQISNHSFNFNYHSRKSSAAFTSDYLYHQLIPYIGNKRKLLPLINEAIDKTKIKSGTFLDLFAGTGVVSRLGKKRGFSVISNDWEYYSYAINRAYIGLNKRPSFTGLRRHLKLRDIEGIFNYLNGLSIKGYISKYYCPGDDDNPDINSERMFFTGFNGRRIDGMREKIDEWEAKKLITSREKCFLLASLIYRTVYVSNTSGVFKAYHKGWGGSKGIALYRIKKEGAVDLVPPVLHDNSQNNRVYREDAGKLINRFNREGEKIDIVYIDTPYNQHQYSTNYHLLNTVALWDKPTINKNFNIRGKTIRKSAIRSDWNKSMYCYRDTALKEFKALIKALRCRYILVSYSSDGIIGINEMTDFLSKKGRLDCVLKTYKRYRVSSQRYSRKAHNIEGVFIVDTKGKSTLRDVLKVRNGFKVKEEKYKKNLPLADIIYNFLKKEKKHLPEDAIIGEIAVFRNRKASSIRKQVLQELENNGMFEKSNNSKWGLAGK